RSDQFSCQYQAFFCWVSCQLTHRIAPVILLLLYLWFLRVSKFLLMRSSAALLRGKVNCVSDGRNIFIVRKRSYRSSARLTQFQANFINSRNSSLMMPAPAWSELSKLPNQRLIEPVW